jgi:hypothetical protein
MPCGINYQRVNTIENLFVFYRLSREQPKGWTPKFGVLA